MPSGAQRGSYWRLSPVYVAGFLDGEGCISIRRAVKNGSDTYTVFCSISNTNIDILKELNRKYGGRLHIDGRKPGRFAPCGNWCLMGAEAVRFMKKIVKHTIIKKKQINVAFDFWKHKEPFHRTNQPKPPGFIEECRRYHELLKSMHGKQGKPWRKFPPEIIEEEMKIVN